MDILTRRKFLQVAAAVSSSGTAVASACPDAKANYQNTEEKLAEFREVYEAWQLLGKGCPLSYLQSRLVNSDNSRLFETSQLEIKSDFDSMNCVSVRGFKLSEFEVALISVEYLALTS